jgi:rod shape-determining protein MreD
MASTAGRLNPLVWIGLPGLMVVLATVVMATPIRLLGMRLPEPVFAVPVLFSWALIRPSFIVPFVVLLLGMFLDMFWGGPGGLWPMSLLVTYIGVGLTRPLLAGQGGPIMWGWYAVASAGCFLTAYLLTSVFDMTAPDVVSVVWQFLATVTLFPVGYWMFERFEDVDVRFK